MKNYPWAGNLSKLYRVIGENPAGSEAEHLEAYRKTLGVVYEDLVPKVKEEVVEEAPKKSKKK